MADGAMTFDGGVHAEVEALQARYDEDMARARRRLAKRERRAWARGVFDGLLSQLTSDDICLDCGGNVGEISGPIAETGAEVYAFEPDPVAFAALSARLAPFPNAHAVQAAVGVTSGSATLHRSSRFEDDPLSATVSSTLMPGKRDSVGGNDITVDVLSLPDILTSLQAGQMPPVLPALSRNRRKPGRLALLKMDVEGGELELLPALHQADLLAGIGCTLVETHQRKFPDRRRDFLSMRRQIAGLYPARKVNLDWI